MRDKFHIDTSEIESIAARLKLKGVRINNQYHQNCSSAINDGKFFLQINGVDIEKLLKYFDDFYANLKEELYVLSDHLISISNENYAELNSNTKSTLEKNF